MALLKNSLIVSFWTMASRGLGFCRDLLIANKLGASAASDAFFIALMLPNLFRRLLGEGAFNVAFVPILAKQKGVSTEAALRFASAAFSWLLLVVSVVVVLGMLFMPGLVAVMVPGFLKEPDKFAMTVDLGRITFPYLGLITVAAFLGAMCNTWGKFAAYAMVPAFLNLSILSCLLLLPVFGLDVVKAAAWSIPLGGLAQVAYMIWASRRLGLKLRLAWLPKHPDLRLLLLRLGPAVIGVGVLQLSLVIDNFIASFLGGPVVSYLQYANRFYQLPMALIGIAVATVLLPQLAVMLGEGKKQEASGTFVTALTACVTLAVGAAVGLGVLSYPLLATFFAHGAFTLEAAWLTSFAMMGFVCGLPAFILTKVTAPAFFASGDPMTPVKASGIALAVNAVGNVVFLWIFHQLGWGTYAHVGIALATALGGYVNAMLQAKWLHEQGILIVDYGVFAKHMRKTALVGAVMMAVGVGFGFILPYPDTGAFGYQMLWLVAAGLLMAGVFVAGVELLGLLKLRQLIADMKAGKRDKASAKLRAMSAGGE